MKKITLLVKSISVLGFVASNLLAQMAPGETFTLNQSVIASGGGKSSGGTITVEGATGQSVAGSQSANAAFTVQHGFWAEPPVVPVNPGVSIGGKVQTDTGQGVKNVRLTLTSSTGTVVAVLTNSFGLFTFNNVPPGDTYIIRATTKRFRIADSIRVVTVSNTITDLNFIALE